ncbi:hypothetical protein [Pontimicrobium sp. MEBiC06410]
MNHYLKTTVLIVVFGTMTVFSKTIKKKTIKSYSKCVAFMSCNNTTIINPLGI